MPTSIQLLERPWMVQNNRLEFLVTTKKSHWKRHFASCCKYYFSEKINSIITQWSKIFYPFHTRCFDHADIWKWWQGWMRRGVFSFWCYTLKNCVYFSQSFKKKKKCVWRFIRLHASSEDCRQVCDHILFPWELMLELTWKNGTPFNISLGGGITDES